MTPTGSEQAPPAALIFDLGGVVFRYQPAQRFDGFARLTGLGAAAVRRRLVDSGYAHACDSGRLDRDGAHREGCRLLGTRIGRATFEEIWISAFQPDAEVVALAAGLGSMRPLALLSNNSALTRVALETRHPTVLDLFRPRLFSAEVGVLKPHPRAFQTILDLLDLAPEQTVYIDDEPANVAAAAALGLRAWRYRGAGQLAEALDRHGWRA